MGHCLWGREVTTAACPGIHCGTVGWWGRMLCPQFWGLARSCAPWQGRALGTTTSQTAVEARPPLTPVFIVAAVREPEGCSICTPES